MDKLTIKFKENRSKNFKVVLMACNKFSKFTSDENWYVLDTDFVECMKRFEDYHTIVWNSQKWASFQYQVNDNLINHRTDFNGMYFYPLQAMCNCIKEREKSIDENFCEDAQGWGCLRLTSINLVPTYYSENNWFDYGYLKAGIWYIDKARLLKEIKREIRLKLVDNCPFFDENRIVNVVNMLPDSIDIATRNWEFKRRTVFDHKTKEFKGDIIGLRWIGNIDEFRI